LSEHVNDKGDNNDVDPIHFLNNIKYIYYVCKYLINFALYGVGTTIIGISKTDLEEIKIPIPSLEEQNEIVSECEYYDSIISQLEKQIEKLEKSNIIDKILKTISKPSNNITTDTNIESVNEILPNNLTIDNIMNSNIMDSNTMDSNIMDSNIIQINSKKHIDKPITITKKIIKKNLSSNQSNVSTEVLSIES